MKVLFVSLDSKGYSELKLRLFYELCIEYADNMTVKQYSAFSDDEVVLRDMIHDEYDAVLFLVDEFSINKSLRIAKGIKKVNSLIKTIFVGEILNFEPQHFMTGHHYIDYIALGEGEATVTGLMNLIFEGDIKEGKIKGLAYRQSGRAIKNPEPSNVVLDTLPFAYQNTSIKGKKAIYYETSRGVRFASTYSNIKSVEKPRMLEIDTVKRDISYFVMQGIKDIYIVDNNFNWDLERTHDLLRYMQEVSNESVHFHLNMNAEVVDEKLIDILRKSNRGMFTITFNLVSLDKKTLYAVNRRHAALEELETIEKIAKATDVKVIVSLIAGLPFEKMEQFIEGFDKIYDAGEIDIDINQLRLRRGSELDRNRAIYSYVSSAEFPGYVISSQDLNSKGLAAIMSTYYTYELFVRKHEFRGAIDHIRNEGMLSPFKFFNLLYEYMRARSLNIQSAEDAARVLLAFAKTLRLADDIKQVIAKNLEDEIGIKRYTEFQQLGWKLAKHE